MKKQKNKRKSKILILSIIVIILFISLLLVNKHTKLFSNKIANLKPMYSTQIGTNGTVVNFENIIAKTNNDVNKPKLSAGMMPVIKLNDNMWQVVSKDDPNWYNYMEGKFAYVMLSDRKVCIRIN